MTVLDILLRLALVLSILVFAAGHFWSRFWAFIGLNLIRVLQARRSRKLPTRRDDSSTAMDLEKHSASVDVDRWDAARRAAAAKLRRLVERVREPPEDG